MYSAEHEARYTGIEGKSQPPLARGISVLISNRNGVNYGQVRILSASCSPVSRRGPSATPGGFPGTLERSLQQSTEPRLRVQNAGVSGGASIGRQYVLP